MEPLAHQLGSLEQWLATTRGRDGYGGPVAHWWQNCFHFTGAGLDWRYEGIILGYLNLYQKSQDERWLAKARQAGDDLVNGQLPGGNFRHSSFELNPYPGGTPHEAACDLALLCLAEVLKQQGDSAWRIYASAAEKNLKRYYIGLLWDDTARHFQDSLTTRSVVPNKAATLAEALFKLSDVTGDSLYAEAYALPTLESVLAHQVADGPLRGAIYQYSVGGEFTRWFLPFYIARCVPALVRGMQWTSQARYLDGAIRAMTFVMRWRQADGGFPQVVYRDGRVNRYPQWIAALGDVLRVLALLEPFGYSVDAQPTVTRLLEGQAKSGGFYTAWGFASQLTQRDPGRLPEFRDILPVVGWSSMAFRYLTEVTLLDEPAAVSVVESYEAPCTVRGRTATLEETATQLALRQGSKLLYHWNKGKTWAEVCDPQLVWK